MAVKIAVVSDTHFGHKKAQIKSLQDFYRLAADKGCAAVVHAGDLCDGAAMRKGHEYECNVHGADALVDFCVTNYPDDLPTYLIGGNHDDSLFKLAGFDIVRAVARDRSDIKYLGMHYAAIDLCGLTIGIYHGAGMGAASNRLMRTYGEATKTGKNFDFIINGHLHSWCAIPFAGTGDSETCLVQAACFQGQTRYDTSKVREPMIGGGILSKPEDGAWQPFFKRYKEE